MPKKILVTGAAGFIGSHLVDFLSEEKIPIDRLRLFVAPNESLANLPQKNFDIIRSDIRNKQAVKKAVEGVETIFHLAARTLDRNRYTDFEEVNIGGTQNLLDACKNKNIQKFVFFSSIAVYGLPAFVGDIINWDETHPKLYTEIYGKSKYEAEKRVQKAYDRWKIPYTIIRPTSVYGPRDKRNLYELYKVIKKGYFFFIGDGANKMDYVFVKDLVKGARLAQLSPRKVGDYILGSGNPITLIDVVKCVAKSINKKSPSFHVPRFVGMFLSVAMETSGNLFNIQTPLFPNRVKVMTANCYYNISRAKRELNYNPSTSFRQGTKITGIWLIKNDLI